MIETVQIFGASGRVGTAMSARLRERGVTVDAHRGDLVLVCVPDRAIAAVAAGIEPGPWVAHTSGSLHEFCHGLVAVACRCSKRGLRWSWRTASAAERTRHACSYESRRKLTRAYPESDARFKS